MSSRVSESEWTLYVCPCGHEFDVTPFKDRCGTAQPVVVVPVAYRERCEEVAKELRAKASELHAAGFADSAFPWLTDLADKLASPVSAEGGRWIVRAYDEGPGELVGEREIVPSRFGSVPLGCYGGMSLFLDFDADCSAAPADEHANFAGGRDAGKSGAGRRNDPSRCSVR